MHSSTGESRSPGQVVPVCESPSHYVAQRIYSVVRRLSWLQFIEYRGTQETRLMEIYQGCKSVGRESPDENIIDIDKDK